jgi:hypothetical protein
MSYPERLAIETQEGEEPFLPEIQHTRGCSGQPLHASWQKASGWTEVGGVQRLHYQGAVFLPQVHPLPVHLVPILTFPSTCYIQFKMF